MLFLLLAYSNCFLIGPSITTKPHNYNFEDDRNIVSSSPFFLHSCPPLTSSNINIDHVSLYIFLSFSKYIIALYHPISYCFFQCNESVLSIFTTEKERLFPAFVASVWAITSGCNKWEVTFSPTTVRMSGFCTVQKRCLICIPVWLSCSTQSSFLSPNPPPNSPHLAGDVLKQQVHFGGDGATEHCIPMHHRIHITQVSCRIIFHRINSLS